MAATEQLSLNSAVRNGKAGERMEEELQEGQRVIPRLDGEIRTPPCIREEELVSNLQKHSCYDSEVVKALEQAAKSHSDQPREIGGDYLSQHVFPVTNNSVEYFAETRGEVPNYVSIVALLHDSVEDDPCFGFQDIEEMFEEYLGQVVKYSVDGLTRRNWRDFQGKDETEKRENAEHYSLDKIDRFEKNLEESDHLYIIKAFDRINNIQCMPIPSRMEKTRKVCENTENIFEPWLREKDSDLADLLSRKRSLLEDHINFSDSLPADRPLYCRLEMVA